MSKGALPTESVAQLFRTAGTDERYKRFKAGEPVETLLAEVEKAKAERATANQKTGK